MTKVTCRLRIEDVSLVLGHDGWADFHARSCNEEAVISVDGKFKVVFYLSGSNA